MNTFEKNLKSTIDAMVSFVSSKGLIDTSELSGTTIPEGTTANYIDLAAGAADVLSLVSYQNMGRHQTFRLNTFEMEDYVLQARPAAGTSIDADNGTSGTFDIPKLISTDCISFAAIHDTAVETSIVDGQLVDLVSTKLATKTGLNLLQLFYFGDTSMVVGAVTGSELKKRTMYKLQNGWISKAGKKIYGLESASEAADEDFDPDNIANVLDTLAAKIDDDYIDRTKMAYILPRTEFNAFQDLIVSLHPNTSTGVDSTTGRKASYWRDIRVIEDMNIAKTVAASVTGGTGKVAMLARLDALWYGIPEELMASESWREAKEESWYVKNNTFPANTISVADAVAVAFYEVAKPTE